MTFKRKALRISGAFLITGLMSSCALIHHDTAPHAQIAAKDIKLASDIHLASDGWPDAQWWTRFNDPQLDALIERALAGSPTMATARLRVTQAQAQVDEVRAEGGPQIGGLGVVMRGRGPASGFLVPMSPWYTAGLLGVFGTWTIDLWGKNRSSVRAAIGEENASVAEAASAQLGLATGVAQAYYSMQMSYRQLDLFQQSKQVLEFIVQAHQDKYARGVEARTSLQSARAQLLALEQQVTAARSQILETREGIRALIGAGADDMPEIKPAPLPEAVLSGVPSTLSYALLARRADLQAMRWEVESSLDQVEAAKAAFYPSLNISAFYGLNAIPLSKLFKSASQQVNLIPGLYLPIFDSGSLNAQLHSARASSDIKIEQYNQAVLDAVRDVAVNGSQLQTLADKRKLQADKLEATRYSQSAAEARYEQGLGSRLAAMEARLPVIEEQASLLSIDGQWVNQQIALIKALGGGYDAEAPASQVAQ
ncbi:MdtP family multidrug efflux transporter outer membrane subunit [Paraburkholderia sp. J7]|uniref:MdtP family multidrug efflux transporter outer membrane subunit n=1 Tax=Paraburkholderia sp. J7 TaxID=2805438 RepID=UPI002AB720C2|nr:MdtP family multidrug efflux transporter outer membrane subunit [Paraburkholderia sp. J7]